MWCEPKIIGPQEIKVNSKTQINKDDMISVGNNENPVYYHILDLINERDSTVKGYKYITLLAQRLKGVKAIEKLEELS